MTYAEYEESVYSGNPIELYQFQREDGVSWRYTSSDEDKIYLNNVYESITIKRDDIENSQDVIRATLNVEMPITEDFIQQFITEPPFIRIALTMWRYHLDNSEVVGLWTGRVINVDMEDSTAKVLCESSYTSLQRTTLRRVYQVKCPYLLYDDFTCKVDKASFLTIATVTDVSGSEVTSPSFDQSPSPYFLGGYVEHTKNGLLSRRFVTNQVGEVITLNLPLYNLEIGDDLDSYPGCDHTLDTCGDKFSNKLNYGGQPWIPQINPLGGTPVF